MAAAIEAPRKSKRTSEKSRPADVETRLQALAASRVVIEDVAPAIDAGRFAVKRL